MHDTSTAPIIKAGFAWGGVGLSKWLAVIGIGTWGDFAAMCAALYSLALLADWAWRKIRKKPRDSVAQGDGDAG